LFVLFSPGSVETDVGAEAIIGIIVAAVVLLLLLIVSLIVIICLCR